MTDLTNWVLIKDIALSLIETNDRPVSASEIREVFEKLHPERKSINVAADMNMLTVNSQSRLSYLHIFGKVSPSGKIMNPALNSRPFDEYPRKSCESNPKDVFFKSGRGMYEKYNSNLHGVWYINLGHDYVNRLKCLSEFEVKEKSFYSDVKESFKLSAAQRSQFVNSVKQVEYEIVQIKRFKRNPHVVAERLHRADGKCDKCGRSAPFDRRSDGTPYLEVHHLVHLSEGGSDSLDNTLALCPNCHREFHFG
ncbi:HNH endonuclease [Pseudoalteromonas sp. SSM20]|uniref:HNH endonuclease n=1 Tax=Pseudoalteromonas sp. SSM20 TaxID=3139394 RepID=UPI003BAAF74F